MFKIKADVFGATCYKGVCCGVYLDSGVVWSATRSALPTVIHVEVKGNDLVGPSSVRSRQVRLG